MTALVKSKCLFKGDTIGLIRPSAGLAGLLPHRTNAGIKYLKDAGFDVVVGKNALKSARYVSASAQERADDIHDMFDECSGMVVGRPMRYSDEDVLALENVIIEQTKNYNFPILFNVDIGHTDPMITIPLGVKVALDSQTNLFEFLEPGVID